MASSPAPSLASTALPGCFSPTPSQTAQSTCDDSTRPVGDVLDEFTISEPTSGVVPAISQLPAEFAAFLAQHGLCLSPEGAVPSPFVIANKSVTTSHGVNENGEKFVQQHVTVNTHEWYTPMLMRTPPIKPVNTETPVIARPPSAPKSTPPPHELNGGASGGASRVWRPEISQNTEFSKFQDSTHNVPYKVSLEHNNSSVPPKGFNNAASPFGSTDPRVKHLQYNSPMNLYSSAAAAEQYAQQTQGLVPQSGNERARSEQPAYLRSETLKVLKEQEQNGHSLSSHPNPQGLPVCYICQRPILGLMAQAGGHHLHADCLACATCGTSLKNIGHHFIDGKFYCDIHQRLKRAASAGPGVDAALLARTPPTAAQPTRPVEPLRGQYQPEVLKATSPSPAAWTSSTTSQSVHTSTPRTHGVISPANRGVPSSQMYGTDFSRSASRGTSLAPPTTVPPPPPPASQPPLAPGARQVTRSALLNSEGSTLTQPASGGKVPFCEACKQQIRGAFVLAQGLSWCPEHFICANSACGRRLLECGFVEENGQKFCETCFESNIAPRCAKCSRPIVSDCLNALQKKWHPQCFTCAHCAKPFGNSAFYLEQGAPYCENDWNRLFTTKCYQCTYPIEAGDRWVEALGHAYHSNCFNCTRCNVNLEGESFYAKNGEPFCKLHA